MATTAKVIIKAEDQISQGLKSAEKNLTSFEKTTKKVGDALKNAFAVTAIISAIKAIGDAVSSCIETFKETESSITRLSAVLNATGNKIGMTTKGLQDLARSLQSVTTYSDETIMGVEQLFITTQKVSRDMLPQATEAALDMATALGQDATSAAERLAQALAQPTEEFEALKEAQIYLDEEQQRNIETLVSQNKIFDAQQIILKEIEETYGGISRSIADTDTGKLTQITNTFENIKSGLGNLFVDTLGPVLEWVYDNLQKIENWINNLNEQRDIKEAVESNSSLGQFSDNALIKALKATKTGTGGYIYNADETLVNKIIEELDSREVAYPGKDIQLSPMMQEIRAWAQEGLEQNRLFQYLINNSDSPLSQEDLIKNNLGVYFDEMDKMYYDYYQEILSTVESLRVAGLAEPTDEPPTLALSSIEDYLKKEDGKEEEQAKSTFKALAPILNPIKDNLDSLQKDFGNALTEISSLSSADWLTEDFQGTFESYQKELQEMTGELTELLYNADPAQKALINASLQEAISFYAEVTKSMGDILAKQDELIEIDKTNKSTEANAEFNKVIEDLSKSINNGLNAESLNKTIEEFNKNRGSVIDFANTDLEKVLFGPMLKEISSAISKIDETLKNTEDVSDENIEQLKAQKDYLTKLSKNVEKSFEEALAIQQSAIEGVVSDTSGIIGFMKGGFSGLVEKSLGNLFDKLSNKGGFIGAIAAIISEILGGILDAIQPILDVLDSVLNPLTVLGTLLKGFSDVLAPAMQSVFQPFIDAFAQAGNYLGTVFFPILETLSPVFQQLGMITSTILMPAFQTLSPIIDIVASVLETLSPIIELVARLLIILAMPIEFVTGLLDWLGSWVKYLGEAVGKVIRNIGYMVTFQWGKISWNFGATPDAWDPTEAWDNMKDRLAKLDETIEDDENDDEEFGTSTGTSISSAGYQGATQVTINIYQQSPVVGSGGMEEFAQMIRKEFEALDYYGVTV